MTSTVQPVAHTLLLAGLVAAIAFDLRERRIPNLLVLAGLGSAGLVHALALAIGAAPAAGPAGWAPLAGAAAGLALMLPLHLLRAMGAGDVKLMAMVGAFTGPAAVASAVLYTLLAGGVLSLAFMLGRGVAVQTLANLRVLLAGRGAPLERTAARLPYAVAIAIGSVAALRWPLIGS